LVSNKPNCWNRNFTIPLKQRFFKKPNFITKKLELSFPIDQGTDYDLSIDLFDEIEPSKTKVNVLLNKIEIIMEKKNKNKPWNKLDSDETEIENKPVTTENKEEKIPE